MVKRRGIRLRRNLILRNDVADDGAALRAGEPDVQALILHRQSCRVYAEQIHHRRVAIVHADGILDGRIPEIVGGAIGQAFLIPPPANMNENHLM